MKSNAAVAVTPINLKIGALVPRSQRELTVRSKFTLEKELDCGLAIVRCGLVEREFGDHIARLNGFIGVPIPAGFSHSCKRAVHCDGTSADMIVTQDSSATTSSADDHDATLVPISSYSLTVSAATKRTCAPEARDDRTLSFPVKLHLILNDNNDTISWNASGRFFVVHKPSEFLAKVIPK